VREEHKRGATFKWIGKPARSDSAAAIENPLMLVYPSGFARCGVVYHPGDFVYAPNPDAKKQKLGQQPQPMIGCIVLSFLDKETDTPMVRLEWLARPLQQQQHQQQQQKQKQQRGPATSLSGSQFGRLYRTVETSDVPISDVGNKCTVLHVQDISTAARLSSKPGNYWWHQYLDTKTDTIVATKPQLTAANRPPQGPKKKRSHH